MKLLEAWRAAEKADGKGKTKGLKVRLTRTYTRTRRFPQRFVGCSLMRAKSPTLLEAFAEPCRYVLVLCTPAMNRGSCTWLSLAETALPGGLMKTHKFQRFKTHNACFNRGPCIEECLFLCVFVFLPFDCRRVHSGRSPKRLRSRVNRALCRPILQPAALPPLPPTSNPAKTPSLPIHAFTRMYSTIGPNGICLQLNQ